MKLSVATIALVVLAPLSARAELCSCELLNPKLLLEHSPVLFVGIPTDPGYVRGGGEADFTVTKSVRGVEGEETVGVKLTAPCDYEFKPGRAYTIPAQRDDEGELITAACSIISLNRH